MTREEIRNSENLENVVFKNEKYGEVRACRIERDCYLFNGRDIASLMGYCFIIDPLPALVSSANSMILGNENFSRPFNRKLDAYGERFVDVSGLYDMASSGPNKYSNAIKDWLIDEVTSLESRYGTIIESGESKEMLIHA